MSGDTASGLLPLPHPPAVSIVPANAFQGLFRDTTPVSNLNSPYLTLSVFRRGHVGRLTRPSYFYFGDFAWR